MIGGVLTEVGKLIYMQTLPLFRFREVYGPFAISATLLFWAYGAALILLFGAHLCAHGFGIPAGAGMPGVQSSGRVALRRKRQFSKVATHGNKSENPGNPPASP